MGIRARRYNPQLDVFFWGRLDEKGAQPNHEHASADTARAARAPTAPAPAEPERTPARRTLSAR